MENPLAKAILLKFQAQQKEAQNRIGNAQEQMIKNIGQPLPHIDQLIHLSENRTTQAAQDLANKLAASEAEKRITTSRTKQDIYAQYVILSHNGEEIPIIYPITLPTDTLTPLGPILSHGTLTTKNNHYQTSGTHSRPEDTQIIENYIKPNLP